MHRDMELVREILDHVRDRKTLDHQPVNLPDRDAAAVARHVKMLIDVGYLEGTSRTGYSGIPMVAVSDLTWEGHEFYGVLASNKGWEEIKKKFSPGEIATMPLAVIKALGIKMVEVWALHQAGLS